jgi:hypothetical protein
VDKYSAVQLPDAAAVLEKLVYTAVNPVAAGLAAPPAEWPGLRTLPADTGTTLAAERPGFLFRSEDDAAAEAEGAEGAQGERVDTEGQARRRRHVRGAPVLPARVELEVTKPPQFEDRSDAEFRTLLAAGVDAAVGAIHAARRAAGRHGFLGAWDVTAQDPESSPGTPGCPDFNLSPTVATRDKWRRIELLQDLGQFRAEYRVAWSAFRAGDRSARFPEGTYGPCVVYGARSHGDPPAHAGAGSRARRAA